MRTARSRAALLLGLAALLPVACSAPDPSPRTLLPPAMSPLPAPLQEEVLAVADFGDQRPSLHRSPQVLQDDFLSEAFPPSWYWYFRPGNVHEAEDTEGLVRATGEGTFLWMPFPWAGVGSSRPMPAALGASDYLALSLQTRGVASRVVRVRDAQEARALGASFLLSGNLLGLACEFVELAQIDESRLDDLREYRIAPDVRLSVALHRLNDDHLLWEGTFDLSEEDAQDFVLDETGAYRGNGYRSQLRLDAERTTDRAFSDMFEHVQRRLETAARNSVAEVENALRHGYAID